MESIELLGISGRTFRQSPRMICASDMPLFVGHESKGLGNRLAHMQRQ